MAEKKVYQFTLSMLNRFPDQYEEQCAERVKAVEEENGKKFMEHLNDIQKRKEDLKHEKISADVKIKCWVINIIGLVWSWMWLGPLWAAEYAVEFFPPLLLIVAYWVVASKVKNALFWKPGVKKYKMRMEALDEESRAAAENLETINRQARDDVAAECTAFRNAFEATATQKATELAGSPAVTSIAQSITEEFIKAINAADRSNHIERIVINYSYRVYTYGVGYTYDNSGAFDFKQHRLPNLSGPLEQVSLARAIAPAVQLEIMMRCPEDPSGTVPVMNIEHAYGEEDFFEYTITTITYTAPNGYYQATRSWT